jgi:hypothetical protein
MHDDNYKKGDLIMMTITSLTEHKHTAGQDQTVLQTTKQISPIQAITKLTWLLGVCKFHEVS